MTCSVSSDAIVASRVVRGVTYTGKPTGNVIIPVMNGRVVTTADVVVTVARGARLDPIGKSANYDCMLTGYSAGFRAMRTSGGVAAGWDFFDENSAKPSFSVSPTPQRLTAVLPGERHDTHAEKTIRSLEDFSAPRLVIPLELGFWRTAP